MNRRNFLTGLASCAATVTAFVSLPSFAAKKPTSILGNFRLSSKGGYVGSYPARKFETMAEIVPPQSWFEENGKIVAHIAPKING